MTEIQIMQRAKMYLDKLVSGINPLDETEIPENDTVRQERIMKCLQYVSGILEQDIAAKQEKQKVAAKQFFVSPERRSRFQVSSETLILTRIAEIINQGIVLAEDGFIPASGISAWLESQGMLRKAVLPNGSYRRYATEAGEAHGIQNIYTISTGKFKTVVYDSQAQQYIFEHIDDISKYCTQHSEMFPQMNSTLPSTEPRSEKILFQLTPEQKIHLHPFADEAKITDITKFLNSLIDTNYVRPLRNGIISAWFASEKMLQYIPSIKKYKPTADGQKIGIVCHIHEWNQFSHPRCIYTPAAQQYIFDHIDDLIEFNMFESSNLL